MYNEMWIECNDLVKWCQNKQEGVKLLSSHYDQSSNKFLINETSLNFIVKDGNGDVEILARVLLGDETATRSLIKGGFAFNKAIKDPILILIYDFMVTSKCGKKILALNNFELAKKLATKIDTSRLIDLKYYPLAFAVIKGEVPLCTLHGYIKKGGPKFVDECSDPFFSYAFNYTYLLGDQKFLYRLEKKDSDYRLKLEQILLSELPRASDLFIKLVLYRTPKKMINSKFINKFSIDDRVKVMQKLINNMSIHNYQRLAPLSTIDSKLNLDQESKHNLEILYNEALIDLAMIMIYNHLNAGYNKMIQKLFIYIGNKLN